MPDWIEAQSPGVIALVLFACCYAVAATIFLGALAVSRRPIAAGLKDVAPVSLTPLGVMLGLLVAFLAARVWGNVDKANQYVGQEAGALRQIVLLADSLPPDARSIVRTAVKRHCQFVETEDWRAMRNGQASLRNIAVGLPEGMTALLSFTPQGASQQLAQERIVIAMEDALEARRGRVRLSRADIAPIQWVAITVLGMLILTTVAMFLIDKPIAMFATIFILTNAFAICLVLLAAYDHPFGPGGFSLEPILIRDVAPT